MMFVVLLLPQLDLFYSGKHLIFSKLICTCIHHFENIILDHPSSILFIYFCTTRIYIFIYGYLMELQLRCGIKLNVASSLVYTGNSKIYLIIHYVICIPILYSFAIINSNDMIFRYTILYPFEKDFLSFFHQIIFIAFWFWWTNKSIKWIFLVNPQFLWLYMIIIYA